MNKKMLYIYIYKYGLIYLMRGAFFCLFFAFLLDGRNAWVT